MNKPKNPKSDADSLSHFVQRAIRQKDLSIRDMQDRAGGPHKIAASYISRIINAKVTNLSVDKLLVLADGLGVDPFELFAAASGRSCLATQGVGWTRGAYRHDAAGRGQPGVVGGVQGVAEARARAPVCGVELDQVSVGRGEVEKQEAE